MTQLLTKRHAFVSPFTNDMNPYNDEQRRLLESLGYEVEPFGIRSLLKSGNLRALWSRPTIVVLNWTELRAFRSRNGRMELSPKGLVALLVMVALLLTLRARIVYFVHNHCVHDCYGWHRRASRWLIGLMCRVADIRGVLDPTATSRYDAQYLPHPLIGRTQRQRAPESRGNKITFLIIGQIRRYKALEQVFQAWPKGLQLNVVGRADPVYAGELAAIIEHRNLRECVSLDDRFIPKEELHDLLAAADVLIIPHQTESALVSSAVFEALGRVPMILARSSPFNEWLASRFKSVCTFTTDEELACQATALAAKSERPDAGADYERAITEFGPDACLAKYALALRADS